MPVDPEGIADPGRRDRGKGESVVAKNRSPSATAPRSGRLCRLRSVGLRPTATICDPFGIYRPTTLRDDEIGRNAADEMKSRLNIAYDEFLPKQDSLESPRIRH